MQVLPQRLSGVLVIRPARDSDRFFVEYLYHETQDDMRLIDTEPEFTELLIGQQQRAQNAMYFIVEKQGERIGRIVLDFKDDEIRIVDIAIIPAARSLGYDTEILNVLKQASKSACAPLVLSVYKQNLSARRLYEQEGFQVYQSNEMVEQMTWSPTYS
jgi:ribosomal protein S18 acetylase RimI-like enzyme